MEKKGKAVVVGVGLKSEGIQNVKSSLNELEELVETAGSEVVGSITQLLSKWTPATLLGSGKVEEIGHIAQDCKAHYVVIDHHLTGVQTRNLEKIWDPIKVYDRSQVIINIFSQRARSFEGKLQVELAQLLDQLPRMVDACMGSLSRQGGGAKTKGPGETALELDRRTIRTRIASIRKRLKEVEKNRLQHRAARKKNKIPSFALIGYTNSGKSTLMNSLTQAEVFAKDLLFATLDPTTRKIFLADSVHCVVTDTVGFINKLPHHLIEAFKATLEESASADVLLHVVDLANPEMDKQVEIVDGLIKEFGWDNKPIIHVYNKIDIAPLKNRFKVNTEPRVFVSAQSEEGLDELKHVMLETLRQLTIPMELFFPIEKQHIIYELQRDVTSLVREQSSAGIICKVEIIPAMANKWQAYRVR